MMFLVVLAAVFGLAFAETTPWAEHDVSSRCKVPPITKKFNCLTPENNKEIEDVSATVTWATTVSLTGPDAYYFPSDNIKEMKLRFGDKIAFDRLGRVTGVTKPTLSTAEIDIISSYLTNCRVDHREHPSDPHKYELSDLAGNWAERTCEPAHLVFVLAERCFCGWPDPELTYGNCSDVNRPSEVSPGLNYMFEYWHPVDNVWKERNCHDTFPLNFEHNNLYVFFNVTGCRCDWVPGHPEYLGPPETPDCTLEMDIEMNKQPPNDTQGSFVQPDCPVWKTWPPTVELATESGRQCMKCNDCMLKSWFLQGNEKKDMCMYFGLYSTGQDDPSQYRTVLADGCASHLVGDTTVFQPSFLFEYRASPMSFRVTYHGGVWTYSPGQSGVNGWVDVALCYRARSWFTMYVNGASGNLVESSSPDAFAEGVNPYFRLSDNCHLSVCGNPLDVDSKYKGCVYWFQERAGGQCAMDERP